MVSPTASKSRRTYTRRNPRTRINEAIDELKELIMKQCNFTDAAVRTAARTAAAEVMNNMGSAPATAAPATAAPEYNPFNNMFGSSAAAAPATRTRRVTKVPLATKLEAASMNAGTGAMVAPTAEAPKSKHPGPGLWNRYLKMWAEQHGIKISEAREDNLARSDYQAARNSGTITDVLEAYEGSRPAEAAKPRTAAPMPMPMPVPNADKKVESNGRLALLKAQLAARKGAASAAPKREVRLNLGNGMAARPANTPMAARPANTQSNLNNV